ncbi:hypothetical protein CIK80_03145 [Psychrobacter sp. JB193]|nr:hypothetical protein CIK80_03145 [Psychrobacter sp. JB193]
MMLFYDAILKTRVISKIKLAGNKLSHCHTLKHNFRYDMSTVSNSVAPFLIPTKSKKDSILGCLFYDFLEKQF